MSRKLYTTVEVARAARVPRATVQHWIKTGKIRAPELQVYRGKAARLWTERQLEELRELKGTLKPGPEKRREPRRGKSR